MGFFSRGNDREVEEPPEHSREIEDLRKLVQSAAMPANVDQVARRELEKLAGTSPSVSEYTIGVNYIEFLAGLPWNTVTEDNLDIERAGKILDEEHYGLTNIKNRILEYLAVRIMKRSCRNTILIVEDDEVARNNLHHVLTRAGYRVVAATSGIDGLARLEQDYFDLVVTDLRMEGVDGMAILEKAKARDAGVEVIMISGYATTPAAVEAMKKGSFHFLAKPFQLEELRFAIEKALEKKNHAWSARGRFCALSALPGRGKHRCRNPSPAVWGGDSSAFPWRA